MFDAIKKEFYRIIEPHRRYMGEKVFRTTVFWDEIIMMVLGAELYMRGGYLLVGAGFAILHLTDYGLWYLEEKGFNFNPMHGKIGRRGN